MEIKKIDAYSSQSLQKVQEQQRQLKGDEKTGSQEASTSADRLELSKGYQEMSQLNKVAMERGDVRTERVDQLRSLVENGLYEINTEETAGNMLEEVF